MQKKLSDKKKNSDDKKVNHDKIRELVELVYISGFLKKEKPLSLFVVAPPEQSKSHFILEKTTKFSHQASDLSFIGLIKLLTENKHLKHVIIPDFLKITEKKQATKNNLLTILNSFLEEGIFEINLGNRDKIDLKGRQGGIITATTDYSYHQNKRNWGGIGFVSRFIIISYKYSNESIDDILCMINDEANTMKAKPKKISYKMTEVKSTKTINTMLNKYNNKSFRMQKNLIVLLKCITLRNGRTQTTKEDIKDLERLIPLMNDGFKEI